MALRWDLRPLFKNAPENSDRANWTRRSVISAGLALTTFTVGTWTLSVWQFVFMAAAFVLAFDAGDMRVPFEDKEAEDPDADRPLTDIELLYRPDNDRRHG